MSAQDNPSLVAGLHHVTAISGDAQGNLDFYAKSLGLRFVKKTVNFDDPSAYHLYYGDETGRAGTIMTFFPWQGARQGRIGAGQVVMTHFATTPGALGFWTARLPAQGAKLIAEEEIFGEKRAVFQDPEGLLFTIVEVASDPRAPWVADDVPEAVALRGFHGVTLAMREGGLTQRILEEVFGYAVVAEGAIGDGKMLRLKNRNAAAADVVDLHIDAELAPGVEGAGIVHHVAFSVPNRTAQAAVRAKLLELGQAVTPAIDRDYFFAIYARTDSGVLFEVATDEPGFAVDEPVEALGSALKLPSQHEPRRDAIEAALPPLSH